MVTVKKVYLITLFQTLIPAYVIERLFWQERGMNITMVVYCEIIYALVITVCEIPSGMMADRFGKKRVLIINNILSVIEFSILLFAYDFWMFALACFLTGIGQSLASGSQNALLYDALLLENKQSEFEKIVGRISAISFIGYALAALSGSVLAQVFGFSLNYMVSIISMSMASILTFSLSEPKIKVPTEKILSVDQYIKQALLFFKNHKAVFKHCLSGAVLGATMIYIDEFWQLLLSDMGVMVSLFGIISALQMIVRIPGNMLAYRLKERFSYDRLFQYIFLINVVSYFVISQTRNIVCLIPILILGSISGIVAPLVLGSLHQEADGQIRATIESFFALGTRIISIVIGLLFGYISEIYSIYGGFLALSGICFLYLLVNHKKES
jgi:predicted MFS family arabinose efflux permease